MDIEYKATTIADTDAYQAHTLTFSRIAARMLKHNIDKYIIRADYI